MHVPISICSCACASTPAANPALGTFSDPNVAVGGAWMAAAEARAASVLMRWVSSARVRCNAAAASVVSTRPAAITGTHWLMRAPSWATWRRIEASSTRRA